jgi:glycosyltransferase involved in cell wall biosynthesis
MEHKLSSVSFFCPAYHDENNLPILVAKVHAFLSKIALQFEIIIVEDGSPDKTGEVADSLAKTFSNVRVIHHEKNKGYGTTLRDGYRGAQYDYVMYTDGDNQYDIEEFEPYLFLLDTCDVISGFVKEKAVSPRRKFQSFVYNTLIMILFFVRIQDVDCSMKIFKKKVLDIIDIQSTSAFIDAEMLIRTKRAGFKVGQFPVTHFERSSGLASGSKMSVIVPTIRDMLKFRFGLL